MRAFPIGYELPAIPPTGQHHFDVSLLVDDVWGPHVAWDPSEEMPGGLRVCASGIRLLSPYSHAATGRSDPAPHPAAPATASRRRPCHRRRRGVRSTASGSSYRPSSSRPSSSSSSRRRPLRPSSASPPPGTRLAPSCTPPSRMF